MSQEGKAKSRIEILEETVGALATAVTSLQKDVDDIKKAPKATGTAVKKGLFGGKREKQAIKDSKTGKIYVSKSAVGKLLAGEADTTADDHFAWYKLMAKFPDRFVTASPEEATKAQAVEDARIAKEVEEANKKLQAEAAAGK